MIEVYTKPNCNFCNLAKELLEDRGIDYREFILDVDFSREHIQDNFPAARTYPIIVVDEQYVGGYQQLREVISDPNFGKTLLID